ncbi:MAG: GNAT family N-acetyltransferase [Bacteroidales bacterium]
MNSHFLTGNTIYLRGIALTDATPAYLSWLNDEEITKGLLTGYYPSTMEELQKFLQGVIHNPNAVMFAICDKITHQHIGNIKIDKFDWIGRTCELGILIGDKNYWGKGVGKEACSLVIQYAFHKLNFRKVLLTVYENNPAAIKLYQKLGFVMEGTLRKHIFVEGEYIDKHFMGLFQEEFKANEVTHN